MVVMKCIKLEVINDDELIVTLEGRTNLEHLQDFKDILDEEVDVDISERE